VSHSDESLKPAAAVNLLPPTWVRWRIVALLLAFSFMSWFNRISMPAAYDEQIKAQYDISPEAIGYVYSALLFVYMVFMTPGGWFADRRGPWLALVLMGFGSALFVALTGAVGLGAFSAAALLTLLLVIRAAMGLFTSPIYPASGRIVAHWLPFHQRAGANGMIMAAAVFGNASAYVGFGMLMDQVGWPKAFLITGTVTAVLALWWTLYARDHPRQHPAVNEAEVQWIRSGKPLPGPDPEGSGPKASSGTTSERSDWRVLLRNRSLILLTLSYAAVGYFEYLFFFWIHYYFEVVLDLGKTNSRFYAAIANLAMAAGMFLGGWLSDRLMQVWGRRPARAAVVVGGMLAGAALLYLAFQTKSPAWIVTWCALAMAAVGATEGPFWATAIELGGRYGGTAAGIFNTGGNAGFLATILTPVIGKRFGWDWAIGLGGLVCLVGAALWAWINPDERAEQT
jgi:sugar phosphate permease